MTQRNGQPTEEPHPAGRSRGRRTWNSLAVQLKLASGGTILAGFTLALVGTLAVCATALERQGENALGEEALREALALLARDLPDLGPDRPAPRLRAIRQRLGAHSSQELLVWIHGSDGGLVAPEPWATGTPALAQLPEAMALRAAARSGGADRAIVTWGGRRFRLHRHPLVPQGGVLWAAEDLTSRRDPRLEAIAGITLIWGVCLVLTLGTIGLLNRRILRPLGDLRRLAGEVGGDASVTEPLRLPGAPVEIRELAVHYDELRQRLDGLGRQQRDFVGAVSHELRNPLMIIGSYLRRLQRRGRNLEPEQMRALATAEAETQRITRLLNDLLDLSRSDAGRLQLKPRAVAVDEILLQACELSRSRLARPLDLRLPACVAEGPVEALADADRLQQVVMNLIENADKYSPDGSPIVVVLRRWRAGVVIQVRDRGIGIPPEDLPQVFQRFQRGRNAIEKARGSGLGLSIVLLLVEAMGGRIRVRSRLDHGSCFSLHLLPLPGP